MPIVLYIIAGVALMVIGGSVFAFFWINRAVRGMECKFVEISEQVRQQDERICVLEKEKHEQEIKYNAMEGAYRAVLEKLDAVIEWAKQMYTRLRSAGITPPEPPADLDIDLRANGQHANGQQWRDFL